MKIENTVLFLLSLILFSCQDEGVENVGKEVFVFEEHIFNSKSLKNPKLIFKYSNDMSLADKSKIEVKGNGTDISFEVKDSADCIVLSFTTLKPCTWYDINIYEGAVGFSKLSEIVLSDFNFKFITTNDSINDRQQVMPDNSDDVKNPGVPEKGQLVFRIDEEPANPNATPEAKKLYSYLKSHFGKNTLAGCFEDMNWKITTTNTQWYKDSIGDYPAIFGYDFMNATRPEWGADSWGTDSYQVFVDNATECWRRGGIVSCMWHWRDPSRKTDSFRPVYQEGGADFDIRKIYDPFSDEYKQMINDIDIVASWLKKLQDNGVPVLWRPLHEAEGTYKNTGWFWWGAGDGADRKRSAACMELWRIMYNRMVYYHGLNNILWVWTSHVEGGGTYSYPWYSDGKRWYPGDDMVDIIGLDIYEKRNEHKNQYQSFARTAMVADMRKIVALTECGFAPSVDMMKEEGCMWAYFMPWPGSFTTSEEYNGKEYLKELYAYDNVITLKDSQLK